MVSTLILFQHHELDLDVLLSLVFLWSCVAVTLGKQVRSVQDWRMYVI